MKKLVLLAGFLLAIGVVAMLAGPNTSSAQVQMTCFKTGERTSGMNKVCSYNCGGSLKEETIGVAQMCAMSVQGQSRNAVIGQQPSRPSSMMCMKSGEQTSGMNKVCYYDCAGSSASTTVGAAQMCQMSIRR